MSLLTSSTHFHFAVLSLLFPSRGLSQCLLSKPVSQQHLQPADWSAPLVPEEHGKKQCSVDSPIQKMSSFGLNLRQMRSRQHDPKCRLKAIYFHHPSQGNSTNYYLILGLQDKAAPPTSQQINKFPPKQVKNLATLLSIFIFVFFFIHRTALLSANQRQWSSNRANVPRTCWAKLFGPQRYLRRILPTRFVKKSWPN